MSYILMIMGIVLIISGGVNAYQYKNHEQYVLESGKQIASLKVNNELNKAFIKKLETQRTTDQANILELSGKVLIITDKLNKKKVILDEYKSRKNLVLKKASLIGRLATRATRRLFKDIYNITGGNKTSKDISPSKAFTFKSSSGN